MSLTPDQIAQIHRDAEETAVAQGLPPKIEDPGAIARIASLVRPTRQRDPAA